MRIAVMAAGGVGGYFGARLAADGHDVFFIARGTHLAALRKDGIKIESVNGDLHLPKINATDKPAEVGPVDIVLFAVKLWSTEEAAEATKPLIGPNTRVITLQNGVDSYERIAPILGKAHAIAGVTYVFTTIAAPGVIKQSSKVQSIICGTADGKPDTQLQAFADAANKIGIAVTISPTIEIDRWQKFIFLAANSGATALTRCTTGEVLTDPDRRQLFERIMRETLAVGRAKGVKLDPAYVDERLAYADKNLVSNMRASMANDLNNGNRLELDWLAGTISRMGKELNVPTPVNDTIYAALKNFRMGRAN
ncbi:MAG: 2-dehydropantoate 2-reductase [Pseudolabrys sp.]|nr:2-dehydropantoate 2-reductase [Pseudolabrys sp.]